MHPGNRRQRELAPGDAERTGANPFPGGPCWASRPSSSGRREAADARELTQKNAGAANEAAPARTRRTMTTIPSTTVRNQTKPVTTGGARTIRAFDGERWTELPCPRNPGRFEAAGAFKQMRLVIDAGKVLTPEEMR